MTDIHHRSGGRRADQRQTGVSSEGEPSLPSALVEEHARIVRSRSAARRVLARGLARRRVLPPLVVGSGALLGSTAIGAWVLGHAPVTTAAAPTSATTPLTTAPRNPDDAQLGLDVAALGRIRQALAADEVAISGLTPSGSGSVSPVAAGGSPAPGASHAGPADGGSAPPGSTGLTGSAGSAGATVPPLPALPGAGSAGLAPLAPLPTIPTVTAPAPTAPPPTHTTTGATVVAH